MVKILTALDIKADLVRRGVRQVDIAQQIGVDLSTLNSFINGRRRPPVDFAARVRAAADLIERADQAAAAARARVLSGEPPEAA